MTGLADQLAEQYPDNNHGVGVTVNSLLDVTVRDVRPTLMLLVAAVALVLLIACANVANLMLARATARRKELALRAALGAGRGRLVRQLLTECMTISLAGGSLGLLVAYWGVGLLVSVSPDTIPRAANIGIDLRVLAFTLLTSVLAGMIFGTVPALQATRLDLIETLNDGGRASAGISRRRLRGILVVAEFALALALMIAAGLTMKSFTRLQLVQPGFDPGNVIAMTMSLPDTRYPDDAKRSGFYKELIEGTRELPGVSSAGAIWPLPLSGSDLISTYKIEGRQYSPDGSDVPECNLYFASPGYFKTMGTRLLTGRDFTDRDASRPASVVIINETFARRYFPGENPVGKRLIDNGPIEIVGVVEDVKEYSLDEETKGQVYQPSSSFSSMVLVVRTQSSPATLLPAIRSQLASVDPDQPIGEVKTMDQYLADSLSISRLAMLLMAVFASVALVLAAVGLYGVIANSVAQRTHEIGIRMALGASRRAVLSLIVGQAMAQAAIGSAIGVALALGLTQSMATLLYGTSATDTGIFAGVTVALGIVALVACLIPGLRATRVEPVTALRRE